MNTDQGSQFTSFAWTDRLRRSGVRISMDGKRRFLDNIFVEALWRSMKYERIYLHASETGSEARAGISKWVEFYNHKRPHSAHGGSPGRGLLVRERRHATRSAGATSSLILARHCPRFGALLMILTMPDRQQRSTNAIPPGRGDPLPMTKKTFLDNPQLVVIRPMPTANVISC